MRQNILPFAILLTLLFLVAANAGEVQVKNMTYSDDYLIKMLDNENLGLRTSAAQLLGERKCLQAVDPLVKMMKHDKEYVARIVAAIVILKISDYSKIEVIREQALREKNKTVRHVLAGVFTEMQKQLIAQK